MTLKLLMAITIVAILICAVSVSAENVTYPQEYYTLKDKSNSYEQYVLDLIGAVNNTWDAKSYLMLHYDIERQNTLMEKQNDLQAELVKAQWVETCYRPLYAGTGSGNSTVWKSECANAGYPVG
jgi:hypothetical protein